MQNSEYLFTHFLTYGTYLRGRPKTRWIESIKEDIWKRESNIRHAVECVKDRNSGRRSSVQPRRRQTTGEDGRAERRKKNYNDFGGM